MVVFDTTFLSVLFVDGSHTPKDPVTQQQIPYGRRRVQFLVSELTEKKERIVVPTPVLAELLTFAGDAAPQYLAILNKAAVFRIVGFDERAAVETAYIIREGIEARDKRQGLEGPWPVIKFDYQILAIAKVESAHTIYSDDRKVKNLGERLGFAVVRIEDLPLPAQDLQGELFKEVEDPDE